jgi:hypothetical protein
MNEGSFYPAASERTQKDRSITIHRARAVNPVGGLIQRWNREPLTGEAYPKGLRTPHSRRKPDPIWHETPDGLPCRHVQSIACEAPGHRSDIATSVGWPVSMGAIETRGFASTICAPGHLSGGELDARPPHPRRTSGIPINQATAPACLTISAPIPTAYEASTSWRRPPGALNCPTSSES